MIAVAVADVLDLMEAALLAATLLVVFRIISVNEARRSINVNVVLTIALSVSLGTAVAVSGLAAEMASVLSRIGDPFGDVGKLVAVLVATMVLTELLSNNAAAAVMLPIATAMAADGGLDPRSMAIVVLIGASCSYLSPIGYQTNLMVYSLGGYRFTDFTRLGAPLTLVTLIVTPIVVPLTIGLCSDPPGNLVRRCQAPTHSRPPYGRSDRGYEACTRAWPLCTPATAAVRAGSSCDAGAVSSIIVSELE